MLEHGWAAESGIGQKPSAHLAAYLYCQAARSGSAEGHYRAGKVLSALGDGDAHSSASFFLATAVELGHARARALLADQVQRHGPARVDMPGCLGGAAYDPPAVAHAGHVESTPSAAATASVRKPLFDLEAYIAALSPARRHVADLVAKHAPDFGIDVRLALAVASVESNFDPKATSPKNARGVMQLIPETAKRFNVADPYDPVQSIKGGLAYLRWLTEHFAGDLLRIIAAYNAGEGAVKQYQGVPPFEETRIYVRRVMELAGVGL